MEELTNWGVGLVVSAMTLGLLSTVLYGIGPAGFIATVALAMGVGCIAAAKWRDVLQLIAKGTYYLMTFGWRKL